MCLDFWSNKIQLNKEDEKYCERTGKPLFFVKIIHLMKLGKNVLIYI